MFKLCQIAFIVMFVVQIFGYTLNKSSKEAAQGDTAHLHRILRSLRQPSIVAEENLVNNVFSKLRTRRSSEECEKLALCKLHADSRHSFVDTFELYFVNKENAQLWDHRTHSAADCARLFAGCYGESESKPRAAPHAAPPAQRRDFRADYSDEDDY